MLRKYKTANEHINVDVSLHCVSLLRQLCETLKVCFFILCQLLFVNICLMGSKLSFSCSVIIGVNSIGQQSDYIQTYACKVIVR